MSSWRKDAINDQAQHDEAERAKTAYQVGDVVTRRDGARGRIVAIDGDQLTVEMLNTGETIQVAKQIVTKL